MTRILQLTSSVAGINAAADAAAGMAAVSATKPKAAEKTHHISRVHAHIIIEALGFHIRRQMSLQINVLHDIKT